MSVPDKTGGIKKMKGKEEEKQSADEDDFELLEKDVADSSLLVADGEKSLNNCEHCDCEKKTYPYLAHLKTHFRLHVPLDSNSCEFCSLEKQKAGTSSAAHTEMMHPATSFLHDTELQTNKGRVMSSSEKDKGETSVAQDEQVLFGRTRPVLKVLVHVKMSSNAGGGHCRRLLERSLFAHFSNSRAKVQQMVDYVVGQQLALRREEFEEVVVRHFDEDFQKWAEIGLELQLSDLGTYEILLIRAEKDKKQIPKLSDKQQHHQVDQFQLALLEQDKMDTGNIVPETTSGSNESGALSRIAPEIRSYVGNLFVKAFINSYKRVAAVRPVAVDLQPAVQLHTLFDVLKLVQQRLAADDQQQEPAFPLQQLPEMVELARKMEKDIFEVAHDTRSYFQMCSKKIYKITREGGKQTEDLISQNNEEDAEDWSSLDTLGI